MSASDRKNYQEDEAAKELKEEQASLDLSEGEELSEEEKRSIEIELGELKELFEQRLEFDKLAILGSPKKLEEALLTQAEVDSGSPKKSGEALLTQAEVDLRKLVLGYRLARLAQKKENDSEKIAAAKENALTSLYLSRVRDSQAQDVKKKQVRLLEIDDFMPEIDALYHDNHQNLKINLVKFIKETLIPEIKKQTGLDSELFVTLCSELEKEIELEKIKSEKKLQSNLASASEEMKVDPDKPSEETTEEENELNEEAKVEAAALPSEEINKDQDKPSDKISNQPRQKMQENAYGPNPRLVSMIQTIQLTLDEVLEGKIKKREALLQEAGLDLKSCSMPYFIGTFNECDLKNKKEHELKIALLKEMNQHIELLEKIIALQQALSNPENDPVALLKKQHPPVDPSVVEKAAQFIPTIEQALKQSLDLYENEICDWYSCDSLEILAKRSALLGFLSEAVEKTTALVQDHSGSTKTAQALFSTIKLEKKGKIHQLCLAHPDLAECLSAYSSAIGISLLITGVLVTAIPVLGGPLTGLPLMAAGLGLLTLSASLAKTLPGGFSQVRGSQAYEQKHDQGFFSTERSLALAKFSDHLEKIANFHKKMGKAFAKSAEAGAEPHAPRSKRLGS